MAKEKIRDTDIHISSESTRVEGIDEIMGKSYEVPLDELDKASFSKEDYTKKMRSSRVKIPKKVFTAEEKAIREAQLSFVPWHKQFFGRIKKWLGKKAMNERLNEEART